MSYRKTNNSFSNWKSYCKENHDLIEELQLPEWVFIKELNFREFVTTGQINKEGRFDFDTIDDELFWKLFYFINDYFDFDSVLFIKFEESRINKGKNERQKSNSKILNELEKIWKDNPGLRLGQIMMIASRPKNPFPEVFYI